MTDDVYDDTPEGNDGYVIPPRHWSRDVHKTPEYQWHRKNYRRECQLTRNDDVTIGLPCWRCHQRIDYRLKWPHPGSFSLDHYHPVRTHPGLVLEPSNFRPSHLHCNQSEHQDDATEDDLDIGEASEIW
jgi:hypothetical protein